MKRLRHPIRSIREPFGKAGLTVAILALVLAMVGGAYAAGALTGKQKKEVEKIAKKFAGKPGAPGVNGANGTNGKDGAAGSNGANGVGVTTETIPTSSASCSHEGGVVVKSASGESLVCNGKKGTNGTNGTNGQPWVPDNTLPSGATETGTWGFGAKEVPVFAPISFTIPLAASLTNAASCGTTGNPECQVHYIDENNKEQNSTVGPVNSTVCLGNAEEPKAAPGNLCIYTAETVGGFGFENETIRESGVAGASNGASTAGAVLTLAEAPGTGASGYGTWAVTAE
jgi:hypothetical protein